MKSFAAAPWILIAALAAGGCSASKPTVAAPEDAYAAHMQTGKELSEKGEGDAAVKEYEAAVKETYRFPRGDPRTPATLVTLGDAYKKVRSYDSAEGAYKQAENIYMFRGNGYEDEFEIVLEKQIVIIYPTARRRDIENLYSRLILLRKTRGDQDSPKVAEWLDARGKERMTLKDYDGARADFERAILIDDAKGDTASSMKSRTSLLLLFYQLGKCDEGVELLRRYSGSSEEVVVENWSKSCRELQARVKAQASPSPRAGKSKTVRKPAPPAHVGP